MAQAINQKTFSDIELISNEGVAILTHRVILKARLPKFYETIKHSQAARLDLSTKTLNYLLHYTYTGIAPSDDSGNLEAIKEFAQRYQLPNSMLGKTLQFFLT